MKFSVKYFFSNCEQNCSFLRIYSHLLKEILDGKFRFLCSVLNKTHIYLVCKFPIRDGKPEKRESKFLFPVCIWELICQI